LLQGLEYTKWLGGIDFGSRNPFTAVWRFFDPSGIFWLSGQLYERGKPLSPACPATSPGLATRRARTSV
jgi:hypothetical protein